MHDIYFMIYDVIMYMQYQTVACDKSIYEYAVACVINDIQLHIYILQISNCCNIYNIVIL